MFGSGHISASTSRHLAVTLGNKSYMVKSNDHSKGFIHNVTKCLKFYSILNVKIQSSYNYDFSSPFVVLTIVIVVYLNLYDRNDQ